MDTAILTEFLPRTAPEGAFDIAIDVETGTPAGALLGLPDWLAALARRKTFLRRLAWDGEAAKLRIEVRRASVDGARLYALAGDRARLDWSDEASAVSLERALARPLDLPGDIVEIAWKGQAIVARGTGGQEFQVAIDPLAAVGEAALDPLAALPGQPGLIGRVAVPATVSALWVLAFTTWAVRQGISAVEQLPLPFLLRPGEEKPAAYAEAVEDAVRLGADGRLRLPASSGGIALFKALAAVPSYAERPLRLHRAPRAEHQEEVLFERTWSVPWEGERLLLALQDLLKKGGELPAAVEVFASETEDVRHEISGRMRQQLAAHGLEDVRLTLIPAYKQAYHYAVEVLLPRLLGTSVAEVEILVPEVSAGDSALEHRCSWVPSVAPADEVMRIRLGLPKDKVRLGFVPGDAFRLRAYDAGRVVLLDEEFRPLAQDYQMEEVYPGRSSSVETGGIRFYGSLGQLLGEVKVPTDTEAAMTAFLEGIADLKHRLSESIDLPFFERLEVEVALSEPDEDLPALWERFSPAEELHEEIYFGALAALEPLTRARSLGQLRAPGSVVPLVQIRTAAETTVRMRALKPVAALASAEPLAISVREIAYRDGEVVCLAEPPAAGYAPLASDLPEGVALEMAGSDRVRALPPADGAPPPAAAYLPEETWPLTRAVAAAAGGIAWIEERTYQGREIPVALWAPEFSLGIASPRRLLDLHPALLVVAGHHANETSSTVSALRFLARLPELGRRAAVLVIPMENPDGAALHRQLARANPYWKLHAARFNALSHEFGLSGKGAPFGESLVRPRLLEEFPIDVLVDDHGVPGHEWAQPFSGRSSPPLFPVAYTYPSGLFYGIGEGSEEEGPDERTLPYWRRVTERLDAHPRLREVQERLWERYERYGKALCPERYPSRCNLGWPFQPTSRATPRMQGGIWPITFVTEVADEGAPAELLAACITAHLEANIAFLEVLAGEGGKPPRNAQPLPRKGDSI
ncbi:MAG: hypothetical protein M0Z66_06030 [Thermaerobacter sp.]|nr:hypothetical protein [Thermaerobacter sp.]